MFKKFNEVYISDIHHYHPEGRLPNSLFEERLDTTGEWISQNVGINERRFLDDYRGKTPVLELCKRVIKKSQINLEEIDCLICASTFADKFYPTTANSVCQEYSLNIANYQILGGCTSLLQAIILASNFVDSDVYKNILILNGEPMTRQVDYGDRTSCILFGDAANLVVVSRKKGRMKVESGNYSGIGMDLVGNYNFSSTSNTTLYEFVTGNKERRKGNIEFNNTMSAVGKFYQDGKGIKKFIYDHVPKVINLFLENNNLTKWDIDSFIFHQANLKILNELIRMLEIDDGKHMYNIDRFGNTASAGWGTVLSEQFHNKRLSNKSVLISSFGAGMTYGNLLLRSY